MNETAFNSLLQQIENLNDDCKALTEKITTGYTSLEYRNALEQAFAKANSGERKVNLSPESLGLPKPAPDFIEECFGIAKTKGLSFRECFRKRFYSCYCNEIKRRLHSRLYQTMLDTIRQTDTGMAERFAKDYSEAGNVLRLVKETGHTVDLAGLDLFAETGDTLLLPLEVSRNESFKISAYIIDIKQKAFVDNPYVFRVDKENSVAYLLGQQGYSVQELADGMNKKKFKSEFIERLAYILNNADVNRQLQLRLLVRMDKSGAGTLEQLAGKDNAVIENAELVLTEDGRYNELIYTERSFDVPVSIIKTKKGFL